MTALRFQTGGRHQTSPATRTQQLRLQNKLPLVILVADSKMKTTLLREQEMDKLQAHTVSDASIYSNRSLQKKTKKNCGVISTICSKLPLVLHLYSRIQSESEIWN